VKPLRQFVDNFFSRNKALPPGFYHFQSPPDAPHPYRLHLRLEEDGTGILIVNASTILHLNQTAAEIAFYLVKNVPEEKAISMITRRYRVNRQTAQQDIQNFNQRLDTLIHTPDLDPVTFLDFERKESSPSHLSAPYRLDCALTYHSVDEGSAMASAHKRVERELLKDEWKSIFTKAFEAGIPHIILTGGEPTIRPDLPELIAFTESLGLVCGLITCGTRLSNPDYLHQLLDKGLDHLLIILDPLEDESWEAIRDTLTEDIFVTVHVTITRHNAERIHTLIDRLAEMGVKALSLSANEPNLKDALVQSAKIATNHAMKMVSDLPVPYSPINPLRLELAEEGLAPAGTSNVSLYVEPDGDVLPAQGVLKILGNLLTDDLLTIWKKG
jgi:organic radical activating enzyme